MKPHRRRPVLVTGALVLAALAGVISLTRFGVPPPQVDPSTPREQNGFRLVAIQRGDEVPPARRSPLGRFLDWFTRRPQNPAILLPNGPGLRVGARWLPAPPPPGRAAPADVPGAFFVAGARASTGDTFPLSWSIGWDGSNRHLFLHTPIGYPDTYRWLDVTVRDRNGHQARWRLGNLPQLRHALPTDEPAPDAGTPPAGVLADDPPVPDDGRVVTPRGAEVQARAWLNPADGRFGEFDFISSALRLARPPVSNPPPNRRWQLQIKRVVYEWEPKQQRTDGDQRDQLFRSYWSPDGFRSASSQTGPGGRGVLARVEGVPATPARTQARVRIFGVLREYDEIHERAIFSAVPVRWDGDGKGRVTLPAPRTAATPSGILVALEEAPAETASEPGKIALALTCRRSRADLNLIPIRDASAQCSVGTDNVPSSSAGFNNDLRREVLLVTPPKPTEPGQPGGVLDTLAIRVWREADRARTPLIFSVPIRRVRPPNDWLGG